jgi:hypothetical protein
MSTVHVILMSNRPVLSERRGIVAVTVDSRWGNAALPELLRVGPADVRKSFSGC